MWHKVHDACLSIVASEWARLAQKSSVTQSLSSASAPSSVTSYFHSRSVFEAQLLEPDA